MGNRVKGEEGNRVKGEREKGKGERGKAQIELRESYTRTVGSGQAAVSR